MEKISRISRRTITSILQKISNVIVTNDFKSCKKHKKLIPVKSMLLMASEYVLKITYFLRIHIWNRTLFQTYPSSICSKFDSYRPETLRQDFYIPKKENYL